MIETIGRGVLDTPHARGMTALCVTACGSATTLTLSFRSQQLRLLRRDRITVADAAAGDHFGVDAAVGVAEPALQRLRDGKVALRRCQDRH